MILIYKKLVVISALIIILLLIVVTVYNYGKKVNRIASNPIITEFTDKIIKTFGDEFLIKFPNNTRFNNAQFIYNYREPRVTLTFEIPVISINDFLESIKNNFKKSKLGISDGDIIGNAESYYESTKRQYTGLFSYKEKDGFKKFHIFYYRPSDKIRFIFENK